MKKLKLLEKRLLAVTQIACELAGRLRAATAAEGDKDHDASRTWADIEDDHEFADCAMHKLSPTLRALKRKHP